jgi:outer membrane protein/adhesin transport system outer membrane protein
MNIIRDEKIVELTLNNEKVLTTHLKAVRDRLKVGDVTKTDVSQSEARLAKAMAGRIAAEGNLKKSRAFFEKIVALSPEHLQKPDINITLPTTLEEALTLAQNNNPAIAVSQFTQQAAKAQTRMIEGELLPTIDLTGSVAKTFNPSLSAAEVDNSRAIGVQAALPLYTGGATLSRIRQSQQNENQQRIDGVNTDRLVHQAVIDAWEGLTSAAAETKARQAQIDASKLALDGVTVERDYGSRSTLDLLDAEQEYLDAQVAFTGAETAKTIATFDLLKSVGNLTVTGLHLETPVYNLDNLFQGGLFQNSKKSWLHKQIHKGK